MSDIDILQPTCQYKYVIGRKNGKQKGYICGQFCRGGSKICFEHRNQLNKIKQNGNMGKIKDVINQRVVNQKMMIKTR